MVLGVEAVEAVELLAAALALERAEFRLIAHSVSVNWRVAYPSTKEKLAHLYEGVKQEPPQRMYMVRGLELRKTVEDLSRRDVGKQVVSLCSRFEVEKGSELHLPLMNLHPDSEMSEEDVVRVVRAVTGGMRGCLLRTGRYYHFYGVEVLDHRAWERMLAQFLMPAVIVSPRYVGHSLYRGYTTVRLTAHPSHKPIVPVVVRVLS